MHSSACDHRVCCNINTACPFGPFYVIPITRTSGTMHPGARQRARVWAVATDPRKRWPPRPGECVQVPQQLEPEATTKSSNHISHSSFFPFFTRKYIKQKYTNTGATTQRLPLALPNPPRLHMHLRTRPFRHPAARACHNTWGREGRRKQMLMEVRIFHRKPSE